MNQIAVIFEHISLHWYSLFLALSGAAGVCFFLTLCAFRQIPGRKAALAASLAVLSSLVLSRIVFWYCRPFSFEGFWQAMRVSASGANALLGAFLGCGLTALLVGIFSGGAGRMLDCMSVAGCGAIALGRLACFFSDLDRGQTVSSFTGLPWVYPIINSTSGLPEYRFATFLFQSMAAGVLLLFLLKVFFCRRKKDGSAAMLFLMVYSAAQVLLDSTRYDSLYLRSNGFVSLVQIAAAVTLAGCIAAVSIGAVRNIGIKKWMAIAWLLIAALFGGAGYMEYFVQRHGKLALLGYSIMGACLAGILVFGIRFWACAGKKKQPEPGLTVY